MFCKSKHGHSKRKPCHSKWMQYSVRANLVRIKRQVLPGVDGKQQFPSICVGQPSGITLAHHVKNTGLTQVA